MPAEKRFYIPTWANEKLGISIFVSIEDYKALAILFRDDEENYLAYLQIDESMPQAVQVWGLHSKGGRQCMIPSART